LIALAIPPIVTVPLRPIYPVSALRRLRSSSVWKGAARELFHRIL